MHDLKTVAGNYISWRVISGFWCSNTGHLRPMQIVGSSHHELGMTGRLPTNNSETAHHLLFDKKVIFKGVPFQLQAFVPLLKSLRLPTLSMTDIFNHKRFMCKPTILFVYCWKWMSQVIIWKILKLFLVCYKDFWNYSQVICDSKHELFVNWDFVVVNKNYKVKVWT